VAHHAGFPHQKHATDALSFLASSKKSLLLTPRWSVPLGGEMKLCGRHKGTLLHHGLPIQASLHIIHNKGFSKQAVSSSSQITTEQAEEENTLGFEVESQRRFLSKLANDLSIHDVLSLSLSPPFSPLIFLYFSSSIQFLTIVFFLLHTEFRVVQHFQKGSCSTRRRKVVSLSFFTCWSSPKLFS